MAHHNTIKANSYKTLSDRLNKFPQGAAPTELLFKILKVLFSEREASLVSLLPIKPFTDIKASLIWGKPLDETKKILNDLADRGILLDYEKNESTTYVLPPPMEGFFEFSLMRYRNDIDQKNLSELFYQYLNVEEDFVKQLFTEGVTRPSRIFVNEEVLTNDNALHVLDFERASEVVKTSKHIGVGVCYCRHKMEHLGKNCKAPMEVCMTFGTVADSLIRHGIAKRIEASQSMEILHQAYEHNLVQFGENVQKNIGYLCNCCGCCCDAMLAVRKFGSLNPIHTTNFLPSVIHDNCNGCGKCVQLCPVEAMTLVSANDSQRPYRKKAKVDEETCLGCAVCLRGCGFHALILKSREKRVITPVTSTQRIVMMAIERGKLQNLLFDNQVLFSHRALAAVLGVILNLSPVKQAMAKEQFKSRYLNMLLGKKKTKIEEKK